jgi:hypothetical protein
MPIVPDGNGRQVQVSTCRQQKHHHHHHQHALYTVLLHKLAGQLQALVLARASQHLICFVNPQRMLISHTFHTRMITQPMAVRNKSARFAEPHVVACWQLDGML